LGHKQLGIHRHALDVTTDRESEGAYGDLE